MNNQLPQRRQALAASHDLNGADLDVLTLFLQRFDRAQTRTAYRSDLVHFFGTSDVTLDLAQAVTFVHLNQYITGLEAEGYKAATLKRRLAAVRGFFDWLMALGAIEHNPAHRQLMRRIRSTGRKHQAVVYLTAQQAAHLVDATADAGEAHLRDRVLLLTLLHCVLRRSEAAAMDVEHVRPLGHYWILDLPHTKGGADQYVKLPAHLVDELENVKQAYGFTSGPFWRSLSNNNRGGRLTPQSVYNIVKATARRAGLSDEIGAHTLRHTGCTLAIEAGASLQQVQSHARHKNIETTMVYVHQRDRLRDSAADYIHIKR